jgi:hypothetical protein
MTYFGAPSGTSRPRLSKRDMIEGAQRRHPGTTIVMARKVDNNTLYYRTGEDGCAYVSLHQTDIICSDGDKLTIDTGGFNTHTTRGRLRGILSEYGAGSVYTNKGVIYHRWNGVSTPFNRRLVIDLEKKTVKPDCKVEALDKVSKQIDAYMAAWKKKGLPKDSSGDPWIFPDKDGRYDIAPEIMLDWVKGKYVFRNLYAYALRHAGVTPGAVVFFMGDVDRKGGKLDRCDLGRIRRFVRTTLGRG